MGQERALEQQYIDDGNDTAEMYANTELVEVGGIRMPNVVQLLMRRERCAISTGRLTVRREIPPFGP